MQRIMTGWIYATKHEMSKACYQEWGVQGMQPNMRCQRHAIKYEVPKACNQAWVVELTCQNACNLEDTKPPWSYDT